MTAPISEIIREQADAQVLDDRSYAESDNAFTSPISGRARISPVRSARPSIGWPRRIRGSHTQLTIGLDPQHIAALSNFKAFLVKHGFLSQDFDLSAWIDASVFDRLTHKRVVLAVDTPIEKASPTSA